MIVYPVTPAWAAPVIRSLEFDTQILKAKNGAEQRWMRHPGRESWTLPYPHLSLSQRNVILDAIDSAKGSFDQTVSLVFNSVTYSGLYIDTDRTEFTEQTPRVWSGSVKLCQVTRTVDTGTLASDFPLLASGAPAQFPFKYARGWDTVAVQTEGGRSSFANRSSVLRSWSVGGSAITDAEALAIWDYFRLCHGMHRGFAYTDADSSTRYTACRFAVDKLDWSMQGAGLSSIQATVQQFL